MQPLRLCIFLASIAVIKASDVLWEASALVTYFNGDFSNSPHSSTGNASCQTRIVPVKLPVFEDQPALFLEKVCDGVTFILQVAVVTEVPGNHTGLKLYDFMDYTGIRPWSYDIQQLSKLQNKDFRTDDDCYAPFWFEGNRVLAFTYPDCRYFIDGKHPRFEGTFIDCRTFVVVFPPSVNQDVLSEPYIFRRTGKRYPVLHYSEDYVSPCED